MENKIKLTDESIFKIYKQFHDKRRIKIENRTESIYQSLIKDNWSESKITKGEALNIAINSMPIELDEFTEFAYMIEDYINGDS
jgi:hypothetical protein